MGITEIKIGNLTEYTETFVCSCGHTQEVKTLGYKMERRQVRTKRRSPCLRCQMNGLVSAKDEKHDKHTTTFCRECGCPPINGKNGCYCNE